MIIHIETQLKTPRELLRKLAFNADLLETYSETFARVQQQESSEGSILKTGSRSLIQLCCATTIKSDSPIQLYYTSCPRPRTTSKTGGCHCGQYQEVIMRNPADVLERAEVLEEKGNYAEAERLYKKALALVSKDTASNSLELVPYVYNLAMAQYAVDHLDDALLTFNRLLSILSTAEEHITGDIQEVRALIADVKKEMEEGEQLDLPMAAGI
jgi:tetratricopeptide (TPR) repeat protein